MPCCPVGDMTSVPITSVTMRTLGCSSHLLRSCGVALLVLLLAACAARVDSRGNLPDPDGVAEIAAGALSRDQVAELLGSPSSISTFDGEAWYYISKRTESLAFFEPDVSERKVVIVRFDRNGLVNGIETLGLEHGREIKPVERETPTAGNELTILDQLIGNFGRFNRPRN